MAFNHFRMVVSGDRFAGKTAFINAIRRLAKNSDYVFSFKECSCEEAKDLANHDRTIYVRVIAAYQVPLDNAGDISSAEQWRSRFQEMTGLPYSCDVAREIVNGQTNLGLEPDLFYISFLDWAKLHPHSSNPGEGQPDDRRRKLLSEIVKRLPNTGDLRVPCIGMLNYYQIKNKAIQSEPKDRVQKDFEQFLEALKELGFHDSAEISGWKIWFYRFLLFGPGAASAAWLFALLTVGSQNSFLHNLWLLTSVLAGCFLLSFVLFLLPAVTFQRRGKNEYCLKNWRGEFPIRKGNKGWKDVRFGWLGQLLRVAEVTVDSPTGPKSFLVPEIYTVRSYAMPVDEGEWEQEPTNDDQAFVSMPKLNLFSVIFWLELICFPILPLSLLMIGMVIRYYYP